MENDHAHLGCCGYDDLATKPPTTQPLVFPRKQQGQQARRSLSNSPYVTRPVYSMGATSPVRFPVMNIEGQR